MAVYLRVLFHQLLGPRVTVPPGSSGGLIGWLSCSFRRLRNHLSRAPACLGLSPPVKNGAGCVDRRRIRGQPLRAHSGGRSCVILLTLLGCLRSEQRASRSGGADQRKHRQTRRCFAHRRSGQASNGPPPTEWQSTSPSAPLYDQRQLQPLYQPILQGTKPVGQGTKPEVVQQVRKYIPVEHHELWVSPGGFLHESSSIQIPAGTKIVNSWNTPTAQEWMLLAGKASPLSRL
jgi:hypothetical protein